MKKIITIIILLCGVSAAKAQTTPPDTTAKKDEIFTRVETSASFLGGIEQLYNFLTKNLKKSIAQGKEIITFIVEKDGSLSEVKAIRSLSPEADKEAIRVMALSPKWNPAMQDGKPVRQQYTIPLTFEN